MNGKRVRESKGKGVGSQGGLGTLDSRPGDFEVVALAKALKASAAWLLEKAKWQGSVSIKI